MSRRSRPHRQRRRTSLLDQITPTAAGIDVGSRSHWVAVDPSLSDDPVREFGVYTDDLHALADWLVTCGVTSVAMESTGVYWIGLALILESRGLEVCLVDARATKQVAGRKTDVSDCQWIQQLHSYGLLKKAFVPEQDHAEIRAYLRQRERWVQDAARAIQHMQQALELMNVKLTEVISDISGTTGLSIIDAIIAGERDPRALARLRNAHCKRSVDEIARALKGLWQPQHLFALEQARDLYRYLGERIAICDRRVDACLQQLHGSGSGTDAPPPPSKRDTSSHPYDFDAHGHCFRMAGVDLTTIDGMGVASVLTILGEIGADLSPWRNEKAFGAWLGLAPNRRVSGNRVIGARTKPSANRAANAFRMAAQGTANSKSAIGANYRRLRARIGAPKAITAIAYKLARIWYRMLTTKMPYCDIGQAAYDQKFAQRRINGIIRCAKDLGFQLVPVTG